MAARAPLQLFPGAVFSGEVPDKWGPRHTALVYKPGPRGLEPVPMLDDAFLGLRVGDRVYVVTGCSHAGVENIVGYAKEVTGAGRLGGVVGGLHLFGADRERIGEVAEALAREEPRVVAATHCTGPFAQPVLRRSCKRPTSTRAPGRGWSRGSRRRGAPLEEGLLQGPLVYLPGLASVPLFFRRGVAGPWLLSAGCWRG